MGAQSFRADAQVPNPNPIVRINTVLGDFSIELFADQAPATVENFLGYVDSGAYNRALFHRLVRDFVLQGGGFSLVENAVVPIPAGSPIANEFGTSNTRGTVAMAKLAGDPDSATSQWFINLADNSGLLDSQNGGFTVFGRVLDPGMEVVDIIAALPIVNIGPPLDELPVNGWVGGPVLGNNLVTMRRVTRIEPEEPPPSFTLNDRGAVSLEGSGEAPATRVGWARVSPLDGATTPAGAAIFGFTNGEGVVVTEASVPAMTPIQEGRVFAEMDGLINTGLAIANPNDEDAVVTFYLTDEEGVDVASGNFTLEASHQIARFLTETPFNGPSPLLGTFTFTSSVPISVVALRTFANALGEFLITTLPVVPLGSETGTTYFPHFVDGSGWATDVILVNPTDEAINGTVEFFGPGSDDAPGEPVTLEVNGQTDSSFAYEIPPASAARLTTSNPTESLASGSIHITPAPEESAPRGLAIFSFIEEGMTEAAAGVPAVEPSTAFRLYVEARGDAGAIGSIQSGVAIANVSDAVNTVTLELTHLDGTIAGPSQSIEIPPFGHDAGFIHEFFELDTDFTGLLRVHGTDDIAVIGLRTRINARSDLLITTLLPSNEVAAPAMSDAIFPHLVDSGGWSTEFVLFSGAAGQTTSVTLTITDQDGEPLDLDLSETQ